MRPSKTAGEKGTSMHILQIFVQAYRHMRVRESIDQRCVCVFACVHACMHACVYALLVETTDDTMWHHAFVWWCSCDLASDGGLIRMQQHLAKAQTTFLLGNIATMAGGS